jgi:peptidoglycan hydrolase CwlO-like protein
MNFNNGKCRGHKMNTYTDFILTEVGVHLSPAAEYYLRTELLKQLDIIQSQETQYENLKRDYDDACKSIGKLEVNIRRVKNVVEDQQNEINLLKSNLNDSLYRAPGT